jgi:hypothetical protein
MKSVHELCGHTDYCELIRNPYLSRFAVETERLGNIDGHRIDSIFEARVMLRKPLAKLESSQSRLQQSNERYVRRINARYEDSY